MEQTEIRRIAEYYKAVADETRLYMLGLLVRHPELCVCDIMHVLGITQSKASRHLRYLRSAGFVADRRDGIWIYYRIAEDLSEDHKAIIEALKSQLDDTLFTDAKIRLAERRGVEHCTTPTRKA